MPHPQLPIFSDACTLITPELGFQRFDGRVIYFNGQMPVFSRASEDIASFRMFTSQLVANGSASQSQIARAFGVPLITVKRMCVKLRDEGPAGFFKPKEPVKGHKLTPERIVQAQGMLDGGAAVPEISAAIGVLQTTLHKAITAGRLKKKPVASAALAPASSAPREVAAEVMAPSSATSASEPSVADGEALFGIATTRECERMAAALGLLEGAPLEFEAAPDIANGGTLCALPALLAFGLLRHHQEVGFNLPKGYYQMDCIFLLLALLALARVSSLEQLRYQPPGEWGKLIGMDRIPEVRTLRHKIGLLADSPERTARWAACLAQAWMGRDESQSIGTLLIDGHTRVYHGALAELPRRYISRERLCLRATTDYWVNALDGAPLFCVTKPIDPGLQQTLEHDIVPRLLMELPGQPSDEQLSAQPHLHRFTLVFDRDGYSPPPSHHPSRAARGAKSGATSRSAKTVHGQHQTHRLPSREQPRAVSAGETPAPRRRQELRAGTL